MCVPVDADVAAAGPATIPNDAGDVPVPAGVLARDVDSLGALEKGLQVV